MRGRGLGWGRAAAGFGDGGLDGGRYGDGRLGGDRYGDGRPGELFVRDTPVTSGDGLIGSTLTLDNPGASRTYAISSGTEVLAGKPTQGVNTVASGRKGAPAGAGRAYPPYKWTPRP